MLAVTQWLGTARKDGGIERKIMQMLLRAVGTTMVHRGCKKIADGLIADLRALTQYSRKSCYIKQDPRLTPNKRTTLHNNIGEGEGNKPCLSCVVVVFFFEGWYSKIGNLEVY